MRSTKSRMRGTLDKQTLDRGSRAELDRLRLLDHAAEVLASSLDYSTTVAAAAQLPVPDLADWCSVDVLVGAEIKQVAVAQRETPELQRLSEVRARCPVPGNGTTRLANAVRTGHGEAVLEVTKEIIDAEANDPEYRAALREANVRSLLIVPMVAREHIVAIGALTMIRTVTSPTFDPESIQTARALARRAGAALDNAQLYRSTVVANESQANFLATMSHELRTPLTAIMGYEELLADGITGTVTDAQKEQLSRIKVSAQQLLGLIDQILLYARLESGRESVHVVNVPIKEMVDEAISVVAPMAEAQHLALGAEAIAPTLAIKTDRAKLRQMLINLLENAEKFTRKGSITVRAFARGADLVFEVTDTGIGIAPENLELIFEAFWQVEQTKTRTVGGSGLGLSTTRRLARLLGGEVTVESRLNRGSTFRIVLPKEPRVP